MTEAPPATDGYVLRPPATDAEWAAYHDIRRRALFAPFHPEVAYDPDHPDERDPRNHPLVLVKDGAVIGTLRIDCLDAERAALRLFAVAPGRQGMGHGRALLRLAEDFVRRGGRRRIVLHGNPEAIGFYLGNGYRRMPWDDDAALGESVDLAKDL